MKEAMAYEAPGRAGYYSKAFKRNITRTGR